MVLSFLWMESRGRSSLITKEIRCDPGAAYIKLGFNIHLGGNIRSGIKG